jgi:hypothetical protein
MKKETRVFRGNGDAYEEREYVPTMNMLDWDGIITLERMTKKEFSEKFKPNPKQQ